jgi:hypothetical protein
VVSAAEPNERPAYSNSTAKPLARLVRLSQSTEETIGSFTHSFRFAFDNGGDHPGYVGFNLKSLDLLSRFVTVPVPAGGVATFRVQAICEGDPESLVYPDKPTYIRVSQYNESFNFQWLEYHDSRLQSWDNLSIQRSRIWINGTGGAGAVDYYFSENLGYVDITTGSNISTTIFGPCHTSWQWPVAQWSPNLTTTNISQTCDAWQTSIFSLLKNPHLEYTNAAPQIPWEHINWDSEIALEHNGNYKFHQQSQTRLELVVGGVAVPDQPTRVNLKVMARELSNGWIPFAQPSPYFFSGQPVSPSNIQIAGVMCADADGSNGFVTVTVPPNTTNLDITPVVSTATDCYSFDVQIVDFQAAVDNNRDGDITFDVPGRMNPDRTAADKPYRFWVNNDYDGIDPGIGDQADLNPATGSDADSHSIGCTRDLEDYTRLWINTQGLTDDLQNGKLLLALEWKNVSSDDDPRIRVFQAVETNGGSLYLTDEVTAQAQTNASYGNCIIDNTLVDQNAVSKYFRFVLPTNIWSNLFDAQPVAHLLFDAVKRGKGQLAVSIYKSDGVTKLAEGPGVWLDLKDVKEMYERWTVGENPGAAPATTASLVSVPYQYDSSIPAENNYILFVHGWNLPTWEKDAFAETAFKRSYWQGYKGRFGEFRWPTDFGFSGIISAITDADNYDDSESNAWASATGLLNKLNDLNAAYTGHVYLMAHSMGNVVAGEALKQAVTNQVVNTYVAMQGAVPAHCYDASTTIRTNNNNRLGLGYNSYAPNFYAHYYTAGAPCYFNDSAGAGSYVNFYNANDWALSYWEVDEDFKPDMGFSYNSSLNKFFAGSTQLDFPQDTYQIFAYCATAFCYALGQQPDVSGAFAGNQLNLFDSPYSFGNLHKGHSAEFNSDNMQRATFWKTLLTQMGLLP